jgi:hypothetical protein
VRRSILLDAKADLLVYGNGERQIVEIAPRNDAMTESKHPEILLVGSEWLAFLPSRSETIQAFLKGVEDRPNSMGDNRIVVESDGHRLAGVSADVRQVMDLRDFAQTFHGIDDPGLADDALRRLMQLGMGAEGATLMESARRHYFPYGELEKFILRVFADRIGPECEAVLWVAKSSARTGSYLEAVVKLSEAAPKTFLHAYIAAGPVVGGVERDGRRAPRRDSRTRC